MYKSKGTSLRKLMHRTFHVTSCTPQTIPISLGTRCVSNPTCALTHARTRTVPTICGPSKPFGNPLLHSSYPLCLPELGLMIISSFIHLQHLSIYYITSHVARFGNGGPPCTTLCKLFALCSTGFDNIEERRQTLASPSFASVSLKLAVA